MFLHNRLLYPLIRGSAERFFYKTTIKPFFPRIIAPRSTVSRSITTNTSIQNPDPDRNPYTIPQNPSIPQIPASVTTSSGSKKTKEVLHEAYESLCAEFKHLQEDINFLGEEIKKKKNSKLRIQYTIRFVAVLFLFLFWRTIKSYISTETSDVAGKAMDTPEFKVKINDLLDHILIHCRDDQEVQKKITELLLVSLKNAINDKGVVDNLTKMTSDVILSKPIQDDLDKIVKELIDRQLNDKRNRELLAETLGDSVNNTYSNLSGRIIDKVCFWRSWSNKSKTSGNQNLDK